MKEAEQAHPKPGEAEISPGAPEVKPEDAEVRRGAAEVRQGEPAVEPGDTDIKAGEAQVKISEAEHEPDEAKVTMGEGAVDPAETGSKAREAEIKHCCAAFYGSDLARALLGESFHPGGAALTERLGRMMNLTQASKVLDAAAGRGASALHLAWTFGCEVVGVDLSAQNLRQAGEAAAALGLAGRLTFHVADVERLPFAAGSFDAVLCECAFCTFPNKQTAAAEFARVLRSDGRLGFSDLTRTAKLAPELDGLVSWIACIADAQPVESYVERLMRAGFRVTQIEDHSAALLEMARQIQGRLLGLEIAGNLHHLGLNSAKSLQRLDSRGVDAAQHLGLESPDFADARRWSRGALEAITQGQLGYAAIVATKS